jgi:nicotinamide-nucleotide amidase
MALSNEILGFAAEIVDHLRQRGETISTAESLTAGSVSSAIVTIAGASDVFVGGTTAYRDEIKVSHLNVDPALIEKHTVISEEVAVAMAKGAIKSFGTTWAIGTTGVAGPNPLDGHPVGVVWVAKARLAKQLSCPFLVNVNLCETQLHQARLPPLRVSLDIAFKDRQLKGV